MGGSKAPPPQRYSPSPLQAGDQGPGGAEGGRARRDTPAPAPARPRPGPGLGRASGACAAVRAPCQNRRGQGGRAQGPGSARGAGNLAQPGHRPSPRLGGRSLRRRGRGGEAAAARGSWLCPRPRLPPVRLSEASQLAAPGSPQTRRAARARPPSSRLRSCGGGACSGCLILGLYRRKRPTLGDNAERHYEILE